MTGRIIHGDATEDKFTIKDSGERQVFNSGMTRDTSEGKIDFLSCRWGPMFRRWNEHLTKGRAKYPDPEPGVPNWTLGNGVEEYMRAKQSAARHFEAWLDGETDEDHAAGVFFNINLAEYVKDKMDFEAATQADAATFSEKLQEEYRKVKMEYPLPRTKAEKDAARRLTV